MNLVVSHKLVIRDKQKRWKRSPTKIANVQDSDLGGPKKLSRIAVEPRQNVWSTRVSSSGLVNKLLKLRGVLYDFSLFTDRKIGG